MEAAAAAASKTVPDSGFGGVCGFNSQPIFALGLKLLGCFLSFRAPPHPSLFEGAQTGQLGGSRPLNLEGPFCPLED